MNFEIVILAWLVAQVFHVLKRDKKSETSPETFELWFYFKDSWVKIVLGLVLSLALARLLQYFESIIQEWMLNQLGFSLPMLVVYFIIGYAPEKGFAYLKDHYASFLQPGTVQFKGKVYNRKSGE